jgi:hypothetical protein
VRPAAQWLSFASPKESHQRKGDPAVCDPFAALRGNLGCSVTGCTAELAARLRRSAQTTAVSQFTKRVCPSAHAPPRALRAPGAARRAWGSQTANNHTGHRCARPRLRSARRLRPREGAEQRDGPCWAFNPIWLRLRRGGCGVSMGASAPMPRQLTRRGCPSGARSAKRVPRRTPQPLRRRFAPTHSVGVADCGSPFFWVRFFGEAKKSTSPAGARPGLRPQQKHTANYKNKSYQSFKNKRYNPA